MRHTATVSTTALAVLAGLTVAGATACTSTSPQSPPPAPPTDAEIAGLFTQWNDALATDNPEKVADRYAPNAVLVPTKSNVVRTDRAGIVDYFTHFLGSDPHAEIVESHIDILDADNAVDAGIYRFHLNQNGIPQDLNARYTFVYEKQNGQWLIVSHHSSAMPEG